MRASKKGTKEVDKEQIPPNPLRPPAAFGSDIVGAFYFFNPTKVKKVVDKKWD